MKKIILLFIVAILLFGCKDFYVNKPKKVIDENQMVEIIYELSLLEAMKSHDIGKPNNYPTATEFLKTKYKIDSLTFAQNTKYYATDVEEYKKMYEKVKEKMNKKMNSLNGVDRIKPPKVEEGIVK